MGASTITLIVGLAGIGGAMFGIVVGQYLTRSWERVQSLANGKKEECRELLTALASCLILFLRSKTESYKTPEEAKRELNNAVAESLRTIWDRMFIAEELNALGIAEKWLKLIDDYETEHDRMTFANGVYAITQSVASIGVKGLREKTLLERFIEQNLEDFPQK